MSQAIYLFVTGGPARAATVCSIASSCCSAVLTDYCLGYLEQPGRGLDLLMPLHSSVSKCNSPSAQSDAANGIQSIKPYQKNELKVSKSQLPACALFLLPRRSLYEVSQVHLLHISDAPRGSTLYKSPEDRCNKC